MMHRAWYCSGEVPYCFSRSSVKFQGHTAEKNHRFWPKLGLSRLQLQFEFTHGFEMMHKAWSSIEEVPYFFSRSSVKFQGHTVQKTSILTQIVRFQTLVWINWWLWNEAQSLKQHRRGALLFFMVIRQISRSQRTKKMPILTRIESFRTVTDEMMHTAWCGIKELPYCFQRSSIKFQGNAGRKKMPILTRIERFRAVTPVWIQPWFWNDAQSLIKDRRGALLFSKVIHQILSSHVTKIRHFWPEFSVSGL